MQRDPNAPPLLLCDIDGVVYPYMDAVRAVAEEIVGHALPSVRWYDLQRSWGISASIHQAAHLRVFATHRSHYMDPVSGAPEALRELHDAGVEIMFLTRRVNYTASIGGSFDRAADITRKWLDGWAPPHDVIFEMHKTDCKRESTLMLEDNPAEAEAMIEQGRQVWLLDQPYNRESDIKRSRWGDRAIVDALLNSDSLAGTTA